MARLRKSLLTAALLLALALGAGLFWREVVVEAAARFGLSHGGLGDARFSVTEVGWSEVVIEDLSLGPGLPEARRVRLRYAPAELISGRVREALVEGMRLALPADWSAARARLSGLASGGGEGWLQVPQVRLEDAVVRLAAPAEGSITLDGTLDLSGARPGAALEIGLAFAGTEGSFTARSASLGPGGALEVSGGGTTELAGFSFPGPGGRLTGGRATFTVDGVVPIPAGDAGTPRAWLDGALALEGALRLADVTAAASPGVLTADLGWALRAGDGTLRLELPRPAELDISGMASLLPDGLRLSAEPGEQDFSATLSASAPLVRWSPAGDGGVVEFAAELAAGLGAAETETRASATLRHDGAWRLSAPAEIDMQGVARGIGWSATAATGRLREAEWALAGTAGADGTVALDGRIASEVGEVSVGALEAGTVTLDGDLRLEAAPGRWSVRFAPDTTLSADGVALPGTLRLDAPLRLSLERLDLTGGGGAPQLDVAGVASPVAGALFDGGEGEVAFDDAQGRVSLRLGPGEADAGALRLEEGRARLPRHGVGLDAVSATVPLPPGADGEAMLASAELRDTGGDARFAPMRVALEGRPEGRPGDGRVAISGVLETLDERLRLPLAGSADLAAATGTVTAGPAHLHFREGGFQPSALSGRLAAFGSVTGAVSVSGDVSVGEAGAVRPRLTLTLGDVVVGNGDFVVEGLSGRITLDSLSPPGTAGPQELGARRAIAGVPVEGPRARLTVLPRAAGPLVRIHEATGALAGGDVVVEDAVWDAAAQENAFAVRVRSVSMERLLREWQIEGITGTGRLSGVIPVRLGPAGLAIEDGHLESAGSGVIAVDWGAARETLVNSGEQVALTVRALEDFHYDSLTIGVSRPADGTLTLDIGLDGSSPEVLDGYPFRFNISLSGQLEPILAAVREGRRIGAELLRGGFGAGR